MDRFAKIKRVVALLVALFVVDAGLLAVTVEVRSPLAWVALGVQLVVVVYFAAVALGLLRELQERTGDKTGD